MPLRAIAFQDADTLNTYQEQAVKVFLECRPCDADYVRTEITYVNYVRDRLEADVHIQSTSQRTGSGGRKYQLLFSGQNGFIHIQDTLTYISKQEDTNEIRRAGLLRILQFGLLRFVAYTPQLAELNISHKKPEPGTTAEVIDRWDYWLFRVGLSSFFNGEKSNDVSYNNISTSARRITEKTITRLSVNQSINKSRYTGLTEAGADTTTRTEQRNGSVSAQFALALGDHFSAGVFFGARENSYSNYKLKLDFSPAIEYNIFPYSESNLRELRIGYRIGVEDAQYYDSTNYDKIEETLYRHTLSVNLEVQEKWGSIDGSISSAQYLHDLGLYHVSINGGVNLRLFKGLSIRFSGGYSSIHDELNLAKGNISAADLYLRLKQQETSYRYRGNVNINYTFGSIYNNVVNTRFGN